MSAEKAVQRASIRDRREELARMSDAELVALCRRDDNLAWETLIRRYRRLVYAIPSRAGLSPDTIETIFHETFAKLAERIDGIDRTDRVRAWMVTTARRLTIDAIRGRTRGRELDDSETALRDLEDPAELPSESVEKMEQRHLVRAALRRMGERCRRLLTALFYDRSDPPRSYESIAAELGMPLGSLGPTRARCLGKLLQEYEDVGND
ncbi:sigma-70 family RNA polymerase sigma factor [bacterium]|nr:sigma-70 family RNA polymerase sigma factor [bacterium]